MSKTLLVAEKPSVGQDLARVLPGPFKKQEGYLEGPDHVVTWAVGHLVQLAEPEAYNAKYKSWRMADLPIVPDRFKLEVRDERSRKQMTVVTKQLGREDVDEVVNACDAGREGELIFAYLFEKAKGKKPVKRLWLNSMTTAAMKSALASLRPAQEFERLEQAARSRSEADWIVGMNARRRRWRSWRAARRRSRPSNRSPTGSWTRPSRPPRSTVRPPASASTSATSRLPPAAPETPKAHASGPSRRRSRSSPPARAGQGRSPS
jgi:DNA topoisomerase IA